MCVQRVAAAAAADETNGAHTNPPVEIQRLKRLISCVKTCKHPNVAPCPAFSQPVQLSPMRAELGNKRRSDLKVRSGCEKEAHVDLAQVKMPKWVSSQWD